MYNKDMLSIFRKNHPFFVLPKNHAPVKSLVTQRQNSNRLLLFNMTSISHETIIKNDLSTTEPSGI